MQSGLDQIGNIGIINFHKSYLFPRKWLLARKILKQNKNLKTIVEKRGIIEGTLRTFKTKHLTGEKTTTTLHKENNCIFYLNIDKTYFSSRLSNERKVISEEVLKLVKKIKNPKILVMFAGVAPYPITIAKLLKKNKIKAEIYSNELNKEANKFAEKNAQLNKLQNEIIFINGDAKKIKTKEKFDIILMTRPNIKDTFLKTALKLGKKGTTIFYHGFGTKDSVLKEIKKDGKKKIGKIKIRKAGDIAPFKFRWQAVFKEI
jgi:tRNA (guanine37-N1)-methyltransferase